MLSSKSNKPIKKALDESRAVFSFDEVFQEKQEYLDYTFEVYSKIYGLDTIKYRCEVPEGLFDSIKRTSFFLLLVMYDENGRIYLSRNIQEEVGWSLPGGSVFSDEDIHSSLRRMARKMDPNFSEVAIGEIEPIVFLENEFYYKNESHSHKGMAFIARIRNKSSININSVSGDFIYLKEHDLSGVNKYANREVVKLAISKIKNINYLAAENEVAVNEKYKLRYLVHNGFVKKFILTDRLKRKREFIDLIKKIVGNAKSLIDVSCGDSNLASKIINPDFDYLVANDISWSQLDLIKSKNDKIIFTNHNATRLPFKDKIFDVAYCGNTLHHMSSRQDLLDLLNGISRVAKKVIIVEIEKPEDTGLFPYILNRFWYRAFLKDVGGCYLSKNTFQDIINKHFSGIANVNFREFKNIQGRYLIAEINQAEAFGSGKLGNNSKLEVEAKFKCHNFDQLRKMCVDDGFLKQPFVREIDDYFTDKEKTFIKDRICLRFRDSNGKLEFTYKGRSKFDSHVFIKEEYNVAINHSEYKEKIKFLESLGFYKYITVIKNRETYTKEEEGVVKNVAIDQVDDIGEFVEFEIVINGQNKYTKEELNEMLNKFINKFSKVGLEKAELPYRDYVAEKMGVN